MIEIKNLTISYGESKIIENFSASIPSGEITAIIGRNGAGKSTLLAAIAGDELSYSGEILLAGKAINLLTSQDLAAIRSLAQQHHSYWISYSAREILALGNESAATERVRHITEALDMQNYLDQSVTTLSGGQLQRVEIARAFIRDVPLVLLDEPFASQDVASTQRLKNFFLAEKSSGRTIVLVAHARADELSWCNSIIDIEVK
jgi:iron complex transport system ATP-binding protein